MRQRLVGSKLRVRQSIVSDMSTHPDLRLSNQLCFALYAATNVITRAYRQPLRLLGLTYPQYLVLLVLWETSEPPTVTQLADALQLDASSLTPLLKRLQTSGFVRRQRDTLDERVVRVTLTGAGRALRTPVLNVRKNVACSTGLVEPEFALFRSQLQKLVHHMSADDAEDKCALAVQP